MSATPPLVTPINGPRPAGPPGRCFYCDQPLGQPHAATCVCWTRKVRVRAIIDYEREVPYHWDAAMIVFHLNESTWCRTNALDEVQEIVDARESESGHDCCACDLIRMEYRGECDADGQPAAPHG